MYTVNPETGIPSFTEGANRHLERLKNVSPEPGTTEHLELTLLGRFLGSALYSGMTIEDTNGPLGMPYRFNEAPKSRRTHALVRLNMLMNDWNWGSSAPTIVLEGANQAIKDEMFAADQAKLDFPS